MGYCFIEKEELVLTEVKRLAHHPTASSDLGTESIYSLSQSWESHLPLGLYRDLGGRRARGGMKKNFQIHLILVENQYG